MLATINGYAPVASSAANAASEAAKAAEAKAEEKKAEETVQARQSESYKPDMEKINQMKTEMGNNVTAFKKMVYSLIKDQGSFWEKALGGSDLLGEILEIDEITQAEAQAAIADDGYWGVEQTAGRILDFAKALSGGDPSKIDMLRDAVTAGFGAAEKVWGGKLPEISQRTYDRVMQGFDDWANEGKTTEVETEA